MDKKQTRYELFITDLVSILNEKRIISLNSLIDHFKSDKFTKSDILLALQFFERLDYLKMTTKQKNQITITLFNQIDISEIFKNINVEAEKSIPPELVVSLPSLDSFGLAAHLDTENVSHISLLETFKDLISKATTSIKIMSPFLDAGGLANFRELLIIKSNAGVNIEIISRNLLKPEKTKRYEELRKFVDKFRKRGNLKRLKFYEYHYSKHIRSVTSSVHAKFIVSDNYYYYCGSGEIRTNSFVKILETGLKGEGSIAISLSKIFDYFTSISEEIKWK